MSSAESSLSEIDATIRVQLAFPESEFALRAIGHYTEDLLFESGALSAELREVETESPPATPLDEAYAVVKWCADMVRYANLRLANLTSTMTEFSILGTKLYEHARDGCVLELSERDIKNLKSAAMVFGAAGTRHEISDSNQDEHVPSPGIMPATTESAHRLSDQLDYFVTLSGVVTAAETELR